MRRESVIKRGGILAYGVGAYLVFLVTFLYLAAFVGDWGVPKSVDHGGHVGSHFAPMLNAFWILLFGLQHAVMARPAFKRRWTSIIHPAVERSTFVLVASGILILMMWQWQPMPLTLWQAHDTWLRVVLSTISIAGWCLALYATFLIDHFDLFGLRQVALNFRGIPYTALRFKERAIYRLVRHPLMLGFLVAFWFTPTMTVGHALFAAVFSSYVILGISLEERDLIQQHGESYRAYRDRTPMLVPRLGFRVPSSVGSSELTTAAVPRTPAPERPKGSGFVTPARS